MTEMRRRGHRICHSVSIQSSSYYCRFHAIDDLMCNVLYATPSTTCSTVLTSHVNVYATVKTDSLGRTAVSFSASNMRPR